MVTRKPCYLAFSGMFLILSCKTFILLAIEVPPNKSVEIDFNHEHIVHLKDSEFFHCSPLAQEKLVECFIGLNPQEQGRTLSRLDFKRRREILRKLTYTQFSYFIEECTQQQWEEIHIRLTPFEQKYVPKDIEEVRQALTKVLADARLNNVLLQVGLLGLNPVFGLFYITASTVDGVNNFFRGKQTLPSPKFLNDGLQSYFEKTFLKN